MVTRLHLFMIVGLSFVLTSIVLVIYTEHRERDHLEYQQQIQKAMLEAATHDISYQISNQVLQVHLFNDEYRELIKHLALHPDDKSTFDIIQKRLHQRLPHVESFTITNSDGVPLLKGSESKIGSACRRDITSFSTEVKRVDTKAKNPIFIHPQEGNYHYDIMASIEDKTHGRNNVFFASFKPLPIQNILKSVKIPGHNLMLVKTDDDTLIEITSDGTREILSRENRLSEQEQITITESVILDGTNWTMIDLKDPAYQSEYTHKLWKESASVLSIVALSNLFLFMLFHKRIKLSELRERRRYPMLKKDLFIK